MPGRWTSPRTRVLPPPQWVPAATLDSLLEESSWRRYNKPSQPVLWLLPGNGWVSSLQRSQGRRKRHKAHKVPRALGPSAGGAGREPHCYDPASSRHRGVAREANSQPEGPVLRRWGGAEHPRLLERQPTGQRLEANSLDYSGTQTPDRS